MLVCLWSPKGGTGTSVFAAACALAMARHRPVRLADFAGDQPAVLGLSGARATGLSNWLEAGPTTPADALDRIALEVAPGLSLLPRGDKRIAPASPEAGAALAIALRDDPRMTFADLGAAGAPALRAMCAVAASTVVVLRPCYLALRRAVGTENLAQSCGAVLLDEPGRALGAREIADLLGVRVLAVVPVRPTIARTVDAGVLVARPPDVLLRAADQFASRLGLDREGRAA